MLWAAQYNSVKGTSALDQRRQLPPLPHAGYIDYSETCVAVDVKNKQTRSLEKALSGPQFPSRGAIPSALILSSVGKSAASTLRPYQLLRSPRLQCNLVRFNIVRSGYDAVQVLVFLVYSNMYMYVMYIYIPVCVYSMCVYVYACIL